MANPYATLPDSAYWRRSVAGQDEIDPVVDVPFRIGRDSRVATAGSCFAQHIARTLQADGFHYFATETWPGSGPDENYGVFPARFGNIYTVRQLLQLFRRAYGLFNPADDVWTDRSGRLVDPFRPRIQAGGFATPAEFRSDRRRHFAAVRTMFDGCDVFVFTLGLTEAWAAPDGAIVPFAPGVMGADAEGYRFVNFEVDEMIADLRAFIDMLRTVNPAVRIILTVSPVPLIATYAGIHVLPATVYSKSALRVVAELATRRFDGVAYFPSYEIITGPQSRGRYFAADAREVTEDGVRAVMTVFRRHFLVDRAAARPVPAAAARPAGPTRPAEEITYIVCDEQVLDG